MTSCHAVSTWLGGAAGECSWHSSLDVRLFSFGVSELGCRDRSLASLCSLRVAFPAITSCTSLEPTFQQLGEFAKRHLCWLV
jgi:hypothetical protein